MNIFCFLFLKLEREWERERGSKSGEERFLFFIFKYEVSIKTIKFDFVKLYYRLLVFVSCDRRLRNLFTII